MTSSDETEWGQRIELAGCFNDLVHVLSAVLEFNENCVEADIDEMEDEEKSLVVNLLNRLFSARYSIPTELPSDIPDTVKAVVSGFHSLCDRLLGEFGLNHLQWEKAETSPCQTGRSDWPKLLAEALKKYSDGKFDERYKVELEFVDVTTPEDTFEVARRRFTIYSAFFGTLEIFADAVFFTAVSAADVASLRGSVLTALEWQLSDGPLPRHRPARTNIETNEMEATIISILTDAARRMPMKEILQVMCKSFPTAESTLKTRLAEMVRNKRLTKRADTTPKGYGLIEWTDR